jgi:hypothetical protein
MSITLPPEELLADKPEGLTANVVGDAIGDRAIARAALTVLAGDDENPGPLDRYLLDAKVLNNGLPLITWYCPACHHIGVIARDLDGDQANLTLGEVLAAVLDHEQEAHR